MLAPPTIVLVGFMGCGKSSVARALAERLRIRSIDLDDVIESHAGTTIAQIFATQGEDAFRRIESSALKACLSEQENGKVLASGGGVVTREENRQILRDADSRGVQVVYLRAEPKTLARRIRRQPGVRPLIDGERILNRRETEERVCRLLEQRAPMYEDVATMRIRSDLFTPEEIAEQIQFAIDARNSRKESTL
jgi:shikimate kinase